MSSFKEPTPLDQPFSGAHKVLKREFSVLLKDFFVSFETEKQTKESLSYLLHRHEFQFLSRAKEIGGKVELEIRQFLQLCANYANGQGALSSLYEKRERLELLLRS